MLKLILTRNNRKGHTDFMTVHVLKERKHKGTWIVPKKELYDYKRNCTRRRAAMVAAVHKTTFSN